MVAAGLAPEDRPLLAVSLGDPYPEHDAASCCYKLVASIILLPPAWRAAFEATESTKGHE